MSDTPVDDGHHDDLVEQAVERAAAKVADAANIAIASVPPADYHVLNRTGSLLAIAVIVIIGLFNLFLNIQTKNEVVRNQEKVEIACKIAALSEGARDAATGPLRLAECLK